MSKRDTRTMEVIQAADIIALHKEAELIIPVSYLTLLRRAKDGCLDTFGTPLSVNRKHLISQFRAGFPPVKKNHAA